MGVAIAKPHPMWLIMLTQVLGDHAPNFSLIIPSISFWQPKQLLVGVAMTKLHLLPPPHVVNNAHQVTWSPYVKFLLIGP